MTNTDHPIHHLILILALAGCEPGVIGVGGPVPNEAADPCGMTQTHEPPPPMLSADCKITAGSCPHRGGDEVHNICADAHAKNVIWDGQALANNQIPVMWYTNPPGGRAGQGCDAQMGTRSFDALSWDSKQERPIVWEVKTEDYGVYPKDIKQCKLERAVRLYVRDCTIVTTCDQMIDVPDYKIRYNFATWDEELYRDMIDYLATHTERLPAGAAEFCNVDNATPCQNGPRP